MELTTATTAAAVLQSLRGADDRARESGKRATERARERRDAGRERPSREAAAADAATARPAPTEDDAGEDDEAGSAPPKRARYAKFKRVKDVSRYSKEDLDAIFGRVGSR